MPSWQWSVCSEGGVSRQWKELGRRRRDKESSLSWNQGASLLFSFPYHSPDRKTTSTQSPDAKLLTHTHTHTPLKTCTSFQGVLLSLTHSLLHLNGALLLAPIARPLSSSLASCSCTTGTKPKLNRANSGQGDSREERDIGTYCITGRSWGWAALIYGRSCQAFSNCGILKAWFTSASLKQ